MLYELATGKKPFTGETRQATVNAILSSEPRSSHEYRRNACHPNSIRFSARHSRKIANFVIKLLQTFALIFVVCCE